MPKNPVRAARQAGRQAVRAAKDTRREKIGAAKTASKVAKIESRTASKVGKISGTTAKPVAKSIPVAKTTTTKVRPGIKGRIAEARSNKQAKNKPATPISYSPTKLPDLPKTSIKITSDMRGTLKDMPAETRKAPTKKGPSESEKNIVKMWRDKGYEYGKDGKVRDKNGKTPEENEAQRVKDMFLQPGETRANTSPFASKEVAAKRALKDALAKIPFGKKKAGGSVKKYQAGGMTKPAVRPGNTVKPPRSVRGPKQSPSDMRQPYGPSMKPVGPGNTARTPKPYRKNISTPASIMKPMKHGGAKKYQDGGKVDPYTTKPTTGASSYKRSGTTLTKNSDGTYSKTAVKKMGGSMKGKKC
jgi:hypothetical protein